MGAASAAKEEEVVLYWSCWKLPTLPRLSNRQDNPKPSLVCLLDAVARVVQLSSATTDPKMSAALALAVSRPVSATAAASLRRHMSALLVSDPKAKPRKSPQVVPVRVLPLRWLSLHSSMLAKDWSQPQGQIAPGEDQFIVRSPYSDVQVPETNLAEYIFQDADKYKNKVALVSKYKTSWIALIEAIWRSTARP
jgi:hypothetical protein